MIGGWKRALVLAPHTDDGEFGCGGTMARLVEDGADVRYVAFSIATRSLPEGFPPDTLRHEVAAATAELGIPAENLTVHDFDVRTFPEHRQEILELLIELWNDWEPDVVFQPSLHDIHQDHQAIATEGLRAFKRTTILGYEIPWNNLDFAYQAYISLERGHLERKVGGARAVRLPAAPPLRRPRVRLEPRPHARDQREPRVRRGLPGLPRDRLEEGEPVGCGRVDALDRRGAGARSRGESWSSAAVRATVPVGDRGVRRRDRRGEVAWPVSAHDSSCMCRLRRLQVLLPGSPR